MAVGADGVEAVGAEARNGALTAAGTFSSTSLDISETISPNPRNPFFFLSSLMVVASYAVIACAVWAQLACSSRSCSLASVRCGLTSNTTFLTVPVNANGERSA